MTAPIDPEVIARILKDERAIPHRLHRPYNGNGTWQPSSSELRLTLVIVMVVVFLMFVVAR